MRENRIYSTIPGTCIYYTVDENATTIEQYIREPTGILVDEKNKSDSVASSTSMYGTVRGRIYIRTVMILKKVLSNNYRKGEFFLISLLYSSTNCRLYYYY